LKTPCFGCDPVDCQQQITSLKFKTGKIGKN
jgi:hypothetical protein